MRKGISFTLTIIIVAVVLMAGALTLVTLFGAGIGDFFGAITDTSTEAQINSACSDIVSEIDRRVCSRAPDDEDAGQNYNVDDISEDLKRSFGIGEEDCNSNNCDFSGVSEEFNDYEVTMDGDDYDCQERGYVPSDEECPVDAGFF